MEARLAEEEKFHTKAINEREKLVTELDVRNMNGMTLKFNYVLLERCKSNPMLN